MFKQRGWVGCVSRGIGLSAFELQNRIHECSEWPCINQPLNMPMLSGDRRIWCKTQLCTTPERQSVPSAKYFFRHTPDNVYNNPVGGSAQVFCVIPFDSPTTRMDSQTALLSLDLLRAQDRDKARTAVLKLGVIRKEYAPVLPGPERRIRLRKRYKVLR